MRRSDIGPFGVAALVLTVLVQVTALTQADALGRGRDLGDRRRDHRAAGADLGLPARACPAARGEGLGALVAGTVHPAIPVALSVGGTGGGC